MQTLVGHFTFLLFLVGLNFTTLSGQTNLPFHSLTYSNGLTQATNCFVNQDSLGRMWISTIEGIDLYNGREVEQVSPKGNKRLNGKIIQSPFFEDTKKKMWFSSQKHLHAYNLETKELTDYQPLKFDSVDYKIVIIGLEKERWLWGTANGVVFILDTHHPYMMPINVGVTMLGIRFEVEKDSNGNFQSIYGCPWHYAHGLEIVKISPEKQVKSYQLKPYLYENMPQTFTGITLDQKNRVWLSSLNGLVLFEKGTFTTFIPDEKMKDKTLSTRPVFIDETTLLCGFLNSSLYHFDIKTQKFSFWKAAASLPKSKITNLYIDRQENVWISIENKGLYFTHLKKNPFLSSIPFSEEKGEPNSIAILQDTFIVGRDNDVVYHSNMEWNQLSNKGGTQFFYIDNELWGIDDVGIYIIKTASNREKKVVDLPGEKVFSCLIVNHFILFATNSGIFSFDTKKKSGLKCIKKLDISHILMEDKERKWLWIEEATKINAYSSNNLHSHLAEPIASITKSCDLYMGLTDTKNNCYWLGCNEGIYKVDRTTFSIEKVNFPQELQIPNLITAITQDAFGALWISTINGLFRYDPSVKINKTRKFSLSDGLCNRSYLTELVDKDREGKLYFASTQGIDIINPKKYTDTRTTIHSFIAKLSIHNQAYDGKIDISNEQSITLPYHQNTLTFNLAAPDFRNPEATTFSVYFKGIGTDTTFLGEQHSITYPNLPPGKYTFMYAASDASGYRNTDFNTLSIHIVPPYWQTWWFRSLVVFFLTGVFIFSVIYYYKNKFKQQQLEMDKQRLVLEGELRMQEERSRIADELHDDLGGKLSTIVFASKRMKKTENIENTRLLVDKVSNISLELIDAMKTIIWAMDSQNDEMGRLYSAIRNYASQFSADNQLPIRIKIPQDRLEESIQGVFRHNVLLTTKELLNNCLKHAQATEVTLTVLRLENGLEITVQDNGSGFDFQSAKGKGKGLLSLEKRMEKINGTIRWSSQTGIGTEVLIFAPIRAVHSA